MFDINKQYFHGAENRELKSAGVDELARGVEQDPVVNARMSVMLVVGIKPGAEGIIHINHNGSHLWDKTLGGNRADGETSRRNCGQ
jgi:hypothetical protein